MSKKNRSKKTKTASAAPKAHLGKRAALESAAAKGKLPSPPNFKAETHRPWRNHLANLVRLAGAADIARLRAYPLPTYSSSPRALDRFRTLCVIALKAQIAAK